MAASDLPGSSLVARGGRGLAALAFDGERRLYVVASGGEYLQSGAPPHARCASSPLSLAP